MARVITNVTPVQKKLEDGTIQNMVQITRVDPSTPGFSETETVEAGSIFDPTSPNYNPVADAE
jgi:hypothetical protein